MNPPVKYNFRSLTHRKRKCNNMFTHNYYYRKIHLISSPIQRAISTQQLCCSFLEETRNIQKHEVSPAPATEQFQLQQSQPGFLWQPVRGAGGQVCWLSWQELTAASGQRCGMLAAASRLGWKGSGTARIWLHQYRPTAIYMRITQTHRVHL